MTHISIRFGALRDVKSLLRYEKEYFPKVAGANHAGYAFEDMQIARSALTEDIAGPLRMWTLVAEVDGEIAGFVTAVPWKLPHGPGVSKDTMLLQYLAVDLKYRRRGIASMLVDSIERRAVAARQNIIIAKVPSSAEFYESNGWTVSSEGFGYAWVPFISKLHADIADPGMGFPRVAAKHLRPKAIRTSFAFPVQTGCPEKDAVSELAELIASKKIVAEELDSDTLVLLKGAELGVPQKVFREVPKRRIF